MIPLITKKCAMCKTNFSFYEVSKGSTKIKKYCNECNKVRATKHADKYKRLNGKKVYGNRRIKH